MGREISSLVLNRVIKPFIFEVVFVATVPSLNLEEEAFDSGPYIRAAYIAVFVRVSIRSHFRV